MIPLIEVIAMRLQPETGDNSDRDSIPTMPGHFPLNSQSSLGASSDYPHQPGGIPSLPRLGGAGFGTFRIGYAGRGVRRGGHREGGS